MSGAHSARHSITRGILDTDDSVFVESELTNRQAAKVYKHVVQTVTKEIYTDYDAILVPGKSNKLAPTLDNKLYDLHEDFILHTITKLNLDCKEPEKKVLSLVQPVSLKPRHFIANQQLTRNQRRIHHKLHRIKNHRTKQI